MNENDITAKPPVVGGSAVQRHGDVPSPDVPPVISLSDAEQQLYDYICRVLRGNGIEHLTAGIAISVIVRTYAQWLEALYLCETKTRTQTSSTGWVTELPWAKDEARLKMELGQWLPKACLTIPSLARVRKDLGSAGSQDDLFADLVNHATTSPVKSSMQ